MYIIEIENNGVTELLHEMDSKAHRSVSDGEFTEDLYAVPSATITVPPQNPAYEHLHESTTLVRFINTRTGETEFDGHILQIPNNDMSASGAVSKKILCEGEMGYLCDSYQLYQHYEETDTTGFLASLLDYHNELMQPNPEKQILLGAVTVHGTNSKTTSYRSTMEEIKENLTSRLGGILHLRRNDEGRRLLDYLREGDFGRICDTKVELARNLKSISVGTDATGVITRLFPLGCQLNDETGERLTIESVNDGLPYIDDEEAIAKYGIRCGTYTWDDVTLPENLIEKGREYLKQACQVKRTYQATVLDLSVIGKDADSFRAGNTYRFINQFVGLDEYLKIIRRTVNIFRPWQPTVEIGDRLERITDIATQARNYIAFEAPKQQSNILRQAKINASALITAATTGFVVVRSNEILIMDTDDVETATSVWRLNSGGIGYSHSDEPGKAYNGEYGLAMTMDGQIVADFIAAGYMYADRIRGGTLVVGGADGRNGVIQVLDDSGKEICRLDKDGASIFGSIVSRNSGGYWIRIDNGSLTGGCDDNTYATVDATATIYDGDNHITYHGLWLSGDAISLRCNMLSVNGGTGTSGGMTMVDTIDLGYSEQEVVTDAWLDDGGNLQLSKTTIRYVSSHNIHWTTYYFTNGLMVTALQ